MARRKNVKTLIKLKVVGQMNTCMIYAHCIGLRMFLRFLLHALRFWRFYRAMHFSAKRGIAISCRLSVRLSFCPSVYLSVTLVNCDHIGWNSSKIISSLVSLGWSLCATPTWRVCSKENTPKFWPKVTHPLLIWASETFDRKLRPNGYR